MYQGCSDSILILYIPFVYAALKRFPTVCVETTEVRFALINVVNGAWSINAALTMHLSQKMFVVHDHPEPGLQMLECSFDYFCQH